MATNTRTMKVLASIVGLVGAVMLAGGGIAWVMVSSQLEAQNMTVSPYTEDDPGKYAGDVVDGPLTAWAQADVIDTHALASTDGKTYAELDKEDPVRPTAMNGSLLRGALFTSVLAFGVSFMAGGVGLVLMLLAAALFISVKKDASVATVAGSEYATA